MTLGAATLSKHSEIVLFYGSSSAKKREVSFIKTRVTLVLFCYWHSGDGQLQSVLWFVICLLLTGCGGLGVTADKIMKEKREWFVSSITERERGSRMGLKITSQTT